MKIVIKLKIRDMQSVQDITRSCLLNNYKIELEAIYKPYPNDNRIDFFRIKIYEKSEG